MLNSLYLRVLASGYDRLIEEEAFESLPGNLNRRLSLIIRGKEALPPLAFPKARATLSTNLAMLSESGAYSDYDVVLRDGSRVKAHRFVLASRSVAYNNYFYQRANTKTSAASAAEPAVSGEDFDFSTQAWGRWLVCLYRGTIDAMKDINAEDVAIIWKLNDELGLDGRLRRDSEAHVTSAAAARLMVYAEKHSIPKLKEQSVRLVSSNFSARVRADPQVWDLIAELPQQSLLSLFRTVITDAAQ